MEHTIEVMHFADTHFGVETYGRLDPATGINTRLMDFKQSLSDAMHIALARGVQLAVFSGDAYKGRDPSQTHQRAFAECIRLLTEKNIPVVMLTGNHDIPSVRGRAHAVEIFRVLGAKNVHILHKPEIIIVETTGGPVQIAAMPYMMKSSQLAREEYLGKTVEQIRQIMESKYVEYLHMLRDKCVPDVPTMMLGHFWVSDAQLSSWQKAYLNLREPQVSVSALVQDPYDYVAMGHIHKHQLINKNGYPSVVYAGSPDRIDFGEKDEPKGFVLVHLARKQTTWEFIEVPGSRPFVEISVDADTDNPTEKILEAIARHNLDGAIARLTYKISANRQPLIRENEIRDALSPAFMVVAIRREVLREQLTRSNVHTESLDPGMALEFFLDQTEKGRKRKPELMPYAERLFDELRKEELLTE